MLKNSRAQKKQEKNSRGYPSFRRLVWFRKPQTQIVPNQRAKLSKNACRYQDFTNKYDI